LLIVQLPSGVPVRILAALGKDVYRKPNVGMFETIVSLYNSKGVTIDLENSVFVGDAAGRVIGKGKSKDHGDSDYKFALNIGVKFVTPETHFLGEVIQYPIPPVGFRPSKLGDLAARELACLSFTT